MFTMPGWDSIEGTANYSKWLSYIGFGALVFATILQIFAYVYQLRKDELVAISETAAAEKRKQEADAAESRRKEEVGELQKKLDQAAKQLAEDHSLRNRVRRLFDTIDTNIVRAIDAGNAALRIRMHPADIEKLKTFLAEVGGAAIGAIRGYGRQIDASSTMNNGSLGPSGSGIPQIEVFFQVGPDLPAKK
jgi:hypothetical protein